MCIRDRDGDGAGEGRRAGRGGGDGGRRDGQGHRRAGARGCLLYTSDAADDLLCVDLGGRRILKKKNYTHTTMTLMTPTVQHNPQTQPTTTLTQYT